MAALNSLVGIVTLAGLCVAFAYFAARFRLGALSLPCLTILTAVVYFYLMPVMAIASGNDEFFGQYLTSLKTVHEALFLYMAGALAAVAVFRKPLNANPAMGGAGPDLNRVAMTVLALLAIAGVLAQVAIGRLQVFKTGGDEAGAAWGDNLEFLAAAYNIFVPLLLVFAVRDRFRWKSMLAVAVVAILFLQVGFRFRLLILACSLISAYLLARGVKVRTPAVIVGALCALMAVNAIGLARSYGKGLDLTRFEGMKITDMFGAYGGEVGIVFVTAQVTENPPVELATVEPWTVGFARLVPRILWPDKPTATYLDAYSAVFNEPGADRAGIAAPQIVELFLQFGWPGVPFLAFGYFAVVCLIASRVQKLGFEGRIAGLAIIPSFFGYYMQTRGYFFQILSDGIFMFAPLFLLYVRVPFVRPAAGTNFSGGQTHSSP